MHKRVAVDRSVSATAVDVAPDVRHHIVDAAVYSGIAVDHVYKRVAVDAAGVVVLVCFSLFASHAATKHIAENVAATDVDKRAVAAGTVADERAVGLVERRGACRHVGRVVVGRFCLLVNAHIGIVAAAVNVAINICVVGNLHLGCADDTRQGHEVGRRGSFRFQSGTSSKHVAMGECTAHIHLRVASNLTCGVVLGRRDVAEATAKHTVDECLAVDGDFGVASHSAGISAAQHSPDSEVGHTL